MVVQLCEYTKNHEIVYFEQIVKCISKKLKKKTKLGAHYYEHFVWMTLVG